MSAVGQMALNLRWTGEFHGPNPHAEAAVVVGEISAHALPDRELISRATADLWAWSGLSRMQAEESSEVCEVDSLLLLGQTAAAWALAALNEVRGFIAHAGAERAGDSVLLWVGFHHAQFSRDALQLALRSLIQLLKGELEPARLKADLQRLWQACRRHHPDYQARILMVGAREMGCLTCRSCRAPSTGNMVGAPRRACSWSRLPTRTVPWVSSGKRTRSPQKR